MTALKSLGFTAAVALLASMASPALSQPLVIKLDVDDVVINTTTGQFFLESFDTDNADWAVNSSTPAEFLTEVLPSTAVNGFIRRSVTLNTFVPPPFGFVFLRGEPGPPPASDGDMNGVSDFAGNYLPGSPNGEILSISYDVRHNASIPLSFGLRAAAPANFPGGSYASFLSIPASADFTTVTFDVSPTGTELSNFSGTGNRAGVFGDLARLQLSTDLTNVPVPEPSALGLVAAGALALLRGRRRIAG